MYAKKIKAVDFRGRTYEREYLFNLTRSELVELEASADGGLQEYIKRIVNTEKSSELVPLFKKLILMSYGEISDDGTMFIKNHPTRGNLGQEFAQTAAFDEMFTEFVTNPDAANEFIQKILPSQEQIDRMGTAAQALSAQNGAPASGIEVIEGR